MSLFKSRRKRELEAELQFKRSQKKINQFISKLKKSEKKYWELAKKALALGDKRQFKEIGAAYLRVRNQIKRWEQYCLKLDMVKLKRDEMSMTGEFMRTMTDMAQSILQGANPEEIQVMQENLEKAFEKVETVSDTMELVMDAGSETIMGGEAIGNDQLAELEKLAGDEIGLSETNDIDTKISAGLKDIEAELKKE